MAGEGSRFSQKGYAVPKPFIDVNGKPMIQCVSENLSFDAEYIFLVRKSHLEEHKGITEMLNLISNRRCKIVEVDTLTEGAACTALLAKNYINDEDDLMIANSDQIIEYNAENFNLFRNLTHVDAIAFSFYDTNPKWSFLKTNSKGLVIEVAEKKAISNIATCGIYWYRRGRDFVRAAERMINNNLRVNNEFYIAPVYNEMIADGMTIAPFFVHKMYGIGTPEDLEKYIKGE